VTAARRKNRRRARKRRREWGPRIKRGLAGLCAAGVALPALAMLLLRWVDPPTTAFILHSRAVATHGGRSDYTPHYAWVDWAQISPSAPLAVIAAEDQRFPEHHGFDLDAIGDALRERAEGGRVRGASTISQQVAKNVFLWPGRSLTRKVLEAYLTVLLEALLPKRRILELYLNIAQFGEGVYGVGAASRRYFAKPPSALRAEEAALLAAVLPAPARMHVDRPSPYVLERRRWILGQMKQLGGAGYLDGL
jgi:monofunctional biosynthetic peptidoglycan transglycosylase